MSATQSVRVRELVGWGLDANAYRPVVAEGKQSHAVGGKPFVVHDPLVSAASAELEALLHEQRGRADLHEEMQGLDWRIGLVDLRQLIAFQRRLVFDDSSVSEPAPDADDWRRLVPFAFGPPVPVVCERVGGSGDGYQFRSENPNLQLRWASGCGDRVLQLHGGSPFFEVGNYRGRWFLRDGYHRAFRLLKAKVTCVPAVIVQASTLAELGAAQPWFFPEQILLSAVPPRVSDFLEDAKTMEYTRPRLFKTIRVRVEEAMEPDSVACSKGETL